MSNLTIPSPFNLSFSAFEAYESCPYRFYQLYVLRKKEPANEYSVYGSAIHELLDDVYKNCMFVKEEVLKSWPRFYEKEVKKAKSIVLSKAIQAKYLRKGIDDINTFFKLAQEEGLLRPCISHEEALIGKYRKCVLRAKLDLVTTIKGGIGILDWKTGKPDRKNLMQLALYAAFYTKKTNVKIDWIIPVYLKTREVVYQAFDDGIKKEAYTYFNSLYNDLITDKLFLPKSNQNCFFCIFRKNGECPLNNPIELKDK